MQITDLQESEWNEWQVVGNSFQPSIDKFDAITRLLQSAIDRGSISTTDYRETEKINGVKLPVRFCNIPFGRSKTRSIARFPERMETIEKITQQACEELKVTKGSEQEEQKYLSAIGRLKISLHKANSVFNKFKQENPEHAPLIDRILQKVNYHIKPMLLDLNNRISTASLSALNNFAAELDVKALSEILKTESDEANLAFYEKGATYETNGEGIIDFSYANFERGFAYVTDGTGHNNPMMAKVLNRIFSEFNRNYEEAHKNAALESTEDYKGFVAEQLKNLGTLIHTEPEAVATLDPQRPLTHMNEPTLKPAFSFVQVACIGEKRYLISLQMSDTTLLIKKADGSFDTSLSKEELPFGLGEKGLNITKSIKITEVAIGDVVYGFSDGIGEFLTMKECQDIISDNKTPITLLNELKDKVVEKGENYVKSDDDPKPREKSGLSANSQKRIKFHKPDDAHFYDDISIFRLLII